MTATIHYKSSRYNGALEPWVVERDDTLGRMLVGLVRYELGFGGTVQKLSSTKIIVKTSFFGNYDIVEFSGSEDAMRALVLATVAYVQACGTMSDELRLQLIQPLSLPGGGYRPLDVVSLGRLLISQAPVKSILLISAGIEPTEAILRHTVDAIEAIVEMALDDGDTATAVELLTAA